ncbi:MAG TPA: hypothetical protein VNT53_02515 [Pseudolysinimonas sp.]|nr:hypothetical protein [Pseudolysinimonas sp.]
MDSSRHNRTLVALSLRRDDGVDFARWCAALIYALNVGTQEVGVRWRIKVGCTASLPAHEVTAATEDARSSGGSLSVVDLDTGDDAWASLSADVIDNDTLVLAVAPDALILASTVTRLLTAYERTPVAVAARTLPFDNKSTHEGLLEFADVPCVLAAAEELASTRVSAVIHPEAVVMCDVAREPGHRADSVPAAVPKTSLLERAVHLVDEVAADAIGSTISSSTQPLLSVVMRTQLHRPEALREALLCLAGQTDDRFELLLVGHDIELVDVENLVTEQPEWLRQRTRLMVASGGTRARPLNVGFGAALGSHVAVLDDDDVVASRWVERFLTAAEAAPGSLVRAVVGVQQVAMADWPGAVTGHATISEVTCPYPPIFDLADHLRVNMTPFMAIAFPRVALARLGGADETLEVCEDWDLILRGAALLGVVDIPHLTAIYRRWVSGGDSYSVHDEARWGRDMQAVRSKLDGMPLVLPPGSALALAAMSQSRFDSGELAEVYRSTSWRVTSPLRAIGDAVQRVRRR